MSIPSSAAIRPPPRAPGGSLSVHPPDASPPAAHIRTGDRVTAEFRRGYGPADIQQRQIADARFGNRLFIVRHAGTG